LKGSHFAVDDSAGLIPPVSLDDHVVGDHQPSLNQSPMSLDPLAVLRCMNKNMHGIFPMLVSMFGGCSEGWLEDLLGAGSAVAHEQA
jgi:hypothetical protein